MCLASETGKMMEGLSAYKPLFYAQDRRDFMHIIRRRVLYAWQIACARSDSQRALSNAGF